MPSKCVRQKAEAARAEQEECRGPEVANCVKMAWTTCTPGESSSAGEEEDLQEGMYNSLAGACQKHSLVQR